MMLCPCCNKPMNMVADVEPVFALPDAVAKLSRADRKAAGVRGNSEVTVLGESTGWVRGLLPMPVHGRERPLNWGVWIELSTTGFDEYIDTCVAAQEGRPFDAQRSWAGKLGNDVGERAGIGSCLDLPVVLTFGDGRQRPRARVVDDHPLGTMQRDGVPEDVVSAWLAPFHAMLGN